VPQQCAGAVLMVRPAAFGFNPETAASNRLQQRATGLQASQQSAALREFDALAQSLRSEGIEVCIAADAADPPKPDAVFPNNWVSFHADGTVVLYPLLAANRRIERREAVIEQVTKDLGFTVRRRVDLTHFESEGRFLEGTGSLVLDHVHRTAYACRSARTDDEVVKAWCDEMGYEPVIFSALDRSGTPYYHTNVVMWIGSRAAMVGGGAIDTDDRTRVIAHLTASGREVIEIGQGEIAGFAGNMLELATWDEALGDASVLVMSARAREALPAAIYARLSACTDVVLAAPVATIEAIGGGGVRCMLAEVFLRA